MTWRKSTYSNGEGGECVELGDLGDAVGVRDSKHPRGPVLTLNRGQLRELVAAVKGGELDHLS